MTAAEAIIRDHFESCLCDLVECYAHLAPTVTCDEVVVEGNVMATVVGFADDAYNASVMIIANSESVGSLLPATLDNKADWLAELSNQLLGRVKNRLAQYGTVPQICIPVAVDSTALSVHTGDIGPTSYRVEWSDGMMKVLLMLKVEDDFELNEKCTDSAAEEGSVSLFDVWV